MNFPCPLLMTSLHFLYQWIVSASVLRRWSTPAPPPSGENNDNNNNNNNTSGSIGIMLDRDSTRLASMSWEEWIAVSIPCGLVTSGDIGLSNLAIVTLSLSFYTMIKASTPIFVLGWAYIFGIERITWPLIGVVLVIGAGEFLTVKGEVDFEFNGFLLCLTAAMLSGARWTMVQLKLQTMDPPLKSPISTMRLLAPSMFASMLLLSLVFEKPWVQLAGYSTEYNVKAVAIGLVGAKFAIAMIFCEFYLIMHASAIILMIGGVMKELLTIILGVTIFKDKLNRINILGSVIVFLGVLLYKVVFHLEKQQKATRPGLSRIESVALPTHCRGRRSVG
jgi:solute carrier family 35, member C2